MRLPNRRENDAYRADPSPPAERPISRSDVARPTMRGAERAMGALLLLFFVGVIGAIYASGRLHAFGSKHVVPAFVIGFIGGTATLLYFRRLPQVDDERQRNDGMAAVFMLACTAFTCLGYAVTPWWLVKTSAPPQTVYCYAHGRSTFSCKLPDGTTLETTGLGFPRGDRFTLPVRRTVLGSWIFEPDDALLK